MAVPISRWATTLAVLACALARPGAAVAGHCADGFSVDKLVAAMAARKGSVAAPAVDSRDLLSYFVYQGLAAGSEEPCGKLAKLGGAGSGKKPWDEMCRTIYYELAYARGLAVQDPLLPQLCEHALMTDPDFELLDRAKLRDSCRSTASRAIPDVCDAFSKMFKDDETARTRQRLCVRFLRSTELGDDSQCADSPDREDVSRCRQYAAFHQARAARDKRLCAKGEVCLAFMGDGARVSEAYALRLKKQFCRGRP